MSRDNDRSWLVDSIGAAAFEQLATGLPGSALQSVLLEVMHQRAAARAPKDLVAQYARDGFVAPALVDLRTSLAVDTQLFATASDFEAIELSPVAPLGASSSVAVTDQHRVLSALRATEVVSDPTNVLALECARRLRTDRTACLRLATSQRVLRAQPVPKQAGFTPHFRMFVLASAGQETREHAFTVQAVVNHMQTLLAGLDALERSGYAFGARRIDILATPERSQVADRIAASVSGDVTRKLLEHPYYSGGLRFQIWATAADGSELPLADGGSFDWLVKLAADRRAVYVASGLGTQLVALRFARAQH